MSIEAMKQALEALEELHRTGDTQVFDMCYAPKVIPALRTAIEQAEKQEPLKLWLWKNFVGGKPEYWAFDNPFPCMSVEGDPITLGEPCGWAFLKPSVNGRPHRSEQEVINTVTRLATTPQPQQAEKQDAEIQSALARAIWDRQDVEALLFKLTGVKWLPKSNTPQPHREWIGLTDEEMHECWDSPLTPLGMKHARMIEAKLKQKNGYAEEKNT